MWAAQIAGFTRVRPATNWQRSLIGLLSVAAGLWSSARNDNTKRRIMANNNEDNNDRYWDNLWRHYSVITARRRRGRRRRQQWSSAADERRTLNQDGYGQITLNRLTSYWPVTASVLSVPLTLSSALLTDTDAARKNKQEFFYRIYSIYGRLFVYFNNAI